MIFVRSSMIFKMFVISICHKITLSVTGIQTYTLYGF
jgi:hypothetical protein